MAILNPMDMRPGADIPLIIVGAGACGLTAALAARDAGVDVVVLERDDKPTGNTSLSQGTICAAGTRSQAEQGVEDNGAIYFADIMTQVGGKTDPIFARHVADNSGLTIDWLTERHGIPLINNPDWVGFGHSRPRMHIVPSRTGVELHGSLLRAASAVGVDIVTGARADDLFVDASGAVVGVRIYRPDGTTEDVGCDALVVATNGFGANREMVQRYIPAMAGARYNGWEGNDGTGIRWGMAMGAAVADMSAAQNFGFLTEPSGVALNPEVFTEGAIQVDLAGRRFSNEAGDISGQGDRVAKLPEKLAWVLLDDRIHRHLLYLPEYADAVNLGALKKAESLVQLALITALPLDGLRSTFGHISAVVNGTRTDMFGRAFTAQSLLEPPYYAIKTTCALFHTLGGLVVNGEAQVTRPDGTCLPNLFAGGGAARNISGPTSSGYIPGSGLCVAVTLGRLAGRGAAALLANCL